MFPPPVAVVSVIDEIEFVVIVGRDLFSEQDGAFTPPLTLLQAQVQVVELSELLTLVPEVQL